MNRQVPNQKYIIIGDGKVAMHIAHYFTLVGITFNQWNRNQSIKALQQAVETCDSVLLLISDDAIQPFINKYAFLSKKTLIHFSGSLTIDNVFGCHPLMTFGNKLYEIETYLSVPFVCDNDIDFNNLFPQLTNKYFNVDENDKAYYHALCVMAGNFTQTLMRETSKQLSEELKLPYDILFPYLLQNTKNYIFDPENSATGPLQRGDFTTVNKHLQAMKNNPLLDIYMSFLNQSNKLRSISNEH